MGVNRPRRSPASKVPRPPTQPLAVWNGVVDTVEVRGWEIGLFYGSGRWTTEVRDRGELLAKSSTGHAAPQAFQIMGSKLKTSLEKSKLLGE